MLEDEHKDKLVSAQKALEDAKKESAERPTTGDENRIFLWIALAVTAAIGFVILLVSFRKKHSV